MPKDERWGGPIVIFKISSGAVNIDARAEIKSISNSTSVTPTDGAYAEMSFAFFYKCSVFLEGPEGVKWELGFACFCTGKMGLWSLGLGFESGKKSKCEWDWCFVSISVGSGHWLVGFGKKWWLGNGIGNPPSGPSSCLLVGPSFLLDFSPFCQGFALSIPDQKQ